MIDKKIQQSKVDKLNLQVRNKACWTAKYSRIGLLMSFDIEFWGAIALHRLVYPN
ncbi:MAG: hypothetical protein KME52_27635 [Desmonostoc geniculatum HA4340-LM1]|jgi:hypothetical protein|nr:hypothetical protein [Desmonostoc geniculatum HA4340-LM1]